MRRLSRRSFLARTGASAALVPLLEMDRKAHAAGPKRLVVCAWTNGFWRAELWPQGEGADFKLKRVLAPLEPWKRQLLVVGGVSLRNFLDSKNGNKKPDAGAGHDAYPAVFTGAPLSVYSAFNERAGGDSIDQYVADRLTPSTPVKNLVIGAQTGSGYSSTVSYRGADSPGVTPENDPARLYRTLFEGRALDKGGIDKVMLRRRGVLDHLGKDLDDFARRVAAEDRAKIQAHAESIRQVERQIQALADGPRCANPGAPGTGASSADAAYPAILKAHTGIVAAALRCNLTRVVSFTMEDSGGDKIFSWMGPDFSGAGDEFPQRTHHDIAHNRKKSPAHTERYVKVNAWFFERVADLVRQLAATPEGNGSVLDNTAVVVGSPMQHNHTIHGVPFVIVGSCGGYFKTGRFVRLGPWKGAGDAVTNAAQDSGWWSGSDDKLPPHNGILIALANAMGVPTEHFGPKEYGGEFPELRG